jgi:hypothetical protein
MNARALILFSGGSDCTLAAAKVAEQKRFDEILLMTYRIPVSCMDENSKRNIPGLAKKYPETRFTHEMLPVGGVLNTVLTKNKLRNLFKHGLIEASLCLHCRLSMYVRTIMYCLDHDIRHVFDGSNVTMALWVDQTPDGVQIIDRLFASFGISLEHPVFYYVGDDLFDLSKYFAVGEHVGRFVHTSTSNELYELGIVPKGNHKTDLEASYRAQPVCLGVVMSLLHSIGLNLPFKSYQEFNGKALERLSDRTATFAELLREYQADRNDSELARAARQGAPPSAAGEGHAAA